MTHKSGSLKRIFLAVGLALAVVVALVAGAIAFLFSLVTDPTPDRYAKVQAGMTTEQVVHIMDGEASRKQPEADGATLWVYPILEGTSGLVLAVKDGKVVRKSALGPPATTAPASPLAGRSLPASPATKPSRP